MKYSVEVTAYPLTFDDVEAESEEEAIYIATKKAEKIKFLPYNRTATKLD